jgi:hypothetical protein
MKSTRTFVNFLIEKDLRERFALACKINNEKMSELLRKYIQAYLHTHEKRLAQKVQKRVAKGLKNEPT